MSPARRASAWLFAAAAGAAVLCCAGPTLLLLAASGVGAVVLRAGASLAVGISLAAAAGIGGLVWWRRRACARRTVPPLRPASRSGEWHGLDGDDFDRTVDDGKGARTMPHGDVTNLELQVRKAMLRRLLRGEAVDLAALGAGAKLRPDEIARALSKLGELGAIHIADGMLIAAYPLSGVPTRHQVRRDGTTIYANCALDALAVPFMMDETATIESDCAHCGKATTVRMSGDRVLSAHPESLVMFHVARDCCEAGPAVLTRCPHINFFCETGHADRWLADHPGRSGDVLSLPQAIARARERFASTISLIRGEVDSDEEDSDAGL